MCSRLLAVALLVLVGCEEKKTDAPPDASAVLPALSAAIASASAAASSVTSAAATLPAVEPASIAAQHILIAYKGAQNAPKTVTRSKADAKKRADEVAAKAKAGGDFSALVAEYSDDPAKGERQGSLGKFTRDKMTKAFSDAAFKLKVDEISDPVETPFGFHVIRRNQ